MILIDNEKTVIAGDALKIITELAASLDRLIHEMTQKRDNLDISYDELMNRFLEVVQEVKVTRGSNDDMNPNDIINSGQLKKLFPEEFFNLTPGSFGTGGSSGSSRSNDISVSDADDALAKAVEKMKQAQNKKNKKDGK